MNPNTPCCDSSCDAVPANSSMCSEESDCARAVMCKYPCYHSNSCKCGVRLCVYLTCHIASGSHADMYSI